MKKTISLLNLVLILVLIFLVNSCKNDRFQDVSFEVNSMSDSLFINDITTNRLSINLKKIDSVFQIENLSEHKKAILYLKKGENYFDLGKNIEALASLKKAKNYFARKQSLDFLAQTNLYLAQTNSYLDNLDIAQLQIDKAFNYFSKKENKKHEQARALNIMAHIYFLQEDFKGATQSLLTAVEIQKERKDTFETAVLYGNIGLIYDMIRNIPLAIENYKKSRKLHQQIESFSSTSCRNLGAIYFELEDYKLAKKYLLETLEIDKRALKPSLQKSTYDDLILVALKQKNIDESLGYIEKRDSLFNIIVKKDEKEKIVLVEKKYDLINKKQELEQANSINEKNRIILTIGFFAILLSSLLFYFKYNNTKLKLLHEKMDLEQTVLRSQMNPHFIFNALTAIQNSLLDNNPLQSASYLSKFSKLIRQNFEFTSKEFISLDEEIDALTNYMETQKIRYKNKFDYSFNIDNELDVFNVQIPPLLLQPFVENAIEHGFKNLSKKGLVEINVSKKAYGICYQIKDNGVGIADKEKDGKVHSLEVFKKRLTLLRKSENQNLSVKSTSSGTLVSFCLSF